MTDETGADWSGLEYIHRTQGPVDGAYTSDAAKQSRALGHQACRIGISTCYQA